MKREQIRQQLRDASSLFADELANMIETQVDEMIAQATEVFELALSAFASELSVTDGAARQHDVPSDGRRSARLQGKRETRRSVSRAEQGKDLPPSTSSAATDLGGEVANAAAKQTPPTTDAAPVSEVATSSTHRRSSEPSATRICGCNARGPHRKDCSLPNTSTSPTSGPPPATITSSPATSSISRSPAQAPRSVQAPGRAAQAVGATAGDLTSQRAARFAEIEASKQRREDAQREREARAKSFVRKSVPRSAPTNPDAILQADALPASITTFEF